jgi:predicted nucleic acid-binding protein
LTGKAVVDASIALKWLLSEEGSAEALALRPHYRLVAPDLLVAECANALWKHVQRGQVLPDEALLAAKLLAADDLELVPTKGLLTDALRLSIELRHPAYDCIYLALAKAEQCPFITADAAFKRKSEQVVSGLGSAKVMTLTEAAAEIAAGRK